MQVHDYPITPTILKIFVLKGIDRCGGCNAYSEAVGVSRGTISSVLREVSGLRPVTIAKIVGFELRKNESEGRGGHE